MQFKHDPDYLSNFWPGIDRVKEVCISIWKKNAIFLFDSHGRNNLGQPISNGYSMVMRFKKKKTLKSIYWHRKWAKRMVGVVHSFTRYWKCISDFRLSYRVIPLLSGWLCLSLFPRKHRISEGERILTLLVIKEKLFIFGIFALLCVLWELW